MKQMFPPIFWTASGFVEVSQLVGVDAERAGDCCQQAQNDKSSADEEHGPSSVKIGTRTDSCAKNIVLMREVKKCQPAVAQKQK
jgi:hypothetical protein